MASVASLLLVVVPLAALAATAIRVVRPDHAGLLEQFGRHRRSLDPGLHFVIPVAQTVRRIDLREQTVVVPPEAATTTDDMVVAVGATVDYRPVDPVKMAYAVADVRKAVGEVVAVALRHALHDTPLEDALTTPYRLRADVMTVLREAAPHWGIEVTRCEIGRPTYRPAGR